MVDKDVSEKKDSKPRVVILATHAHGLILRPANKKEVEGTLVSIPSIRLDFQFQKHLVWDSAVDGKHLSNKELKFVRDKMQEKMDAGIIDYRFLEPDAVDAVDQIKENIEKNVTPTRRPKGGVTRGFRKVGGK